MPRKDIHPKRNKIRIKLVNGDEYETHSTWGEKDGDVLQLDTDPSVHNAWTGSSNRVLKKGGRASTFSSRYGDFGLDAE